MFAGGFIQRCAIIKRIPIFSQLHWFDIQFIAQKSELIRFKRGEVVSKKGAPADYVFFLTSGRLISYNIEFDKKEDIEHIHRGMFFGIISALTGEVHSETFEAINDSLILRIPFEYFKELMTRIPQLGIKFSKALSERIRSKVTKTNLVTKSSIISVYAPIAGSGGSTYSLNLAKTLLKETSDKVIWLHIRTTKAPIHFFDSGSDDLRPHWKKEPLDLSQAPCDIEQLSPHITTSLLGFDILNLVLDSSQEKVIDNISDFIACFIDVYRYIIVDLPSDMDDVVLQMLSQSDIVHLLMLRKKHELKVGRDILNKVLEQSKNFFLTKEKIKIIVSGVNTHRGVSEKVITKILKHRPDIFLPFIQQKDLTILIDTPEFSFWGLNAESAYLRIITRISREISGTSIGLVFGGGAAFGLAHIGVIRVLEEENIPVDFIAGSSMGALIGALWALGYRSHELQKFAFEFKNKTNLFKLIDLVFPLSGLISGRAIKNWLKSKYGSKTFNDTIIPLKVVAYDLIHRKDIILDEGPLVDAVRKSISIPGVFQPIVTEDSVIIDGGVMNPLPTNVLVKQGMKNIIAVNVLQSAEDVIKGYEKAKKELKKDLEVPFLVHPGFFIKTRIRSWVRKILFPNISDIIVRTLEASEAVIADQSAKAASIVIHPDLEGLDWFELYHADILIKRGEDAARKHIHQIKALVKKG